MRWVVKAEIIREDGTLDAVELGSVERAGPTEPKDVGLTLAETKPLLMGLQALVVREQLRRHSEQARVCAACGTRRALKDYRGRRISTVLGTVDVRAPRFRGCQCPGTSGSFSPISQLLPDRTTPELRHLQVTLGARLPYRQAAEMLQLFLPANRGFSHVTTRNRTLAVGRAIDEELCREVADDTAPLAPADRMVLGIDGAFVKAKRTTGRTHFEVLTGRIERAGERHGQAFAVVRDLDALAKPRVRALLRRHGRGPGTALTVLSDGEVGMRTIVGTWFGARSAHVLDWFHIARRLDRISQAFLYLPHITDFEHRLRRHCEQLGHVRWRLWHGTLDRADWALLWLRASIDEHLYMAQATEPECVDDQNLSHVVHLRTLLVELRRYLMANRTSLTNYGAAYRRGERVATAHVESTVNQVINQRMCKKQQMRWTRPGAQYLLHARTAMINGNLGRYTGVGEDEQEAA